MRSVKSTALAFSVLTSSVAPNAVLADSADSYVQTHNAVCSDDESYSFKLLSSPLLDMVRKEFSASPAYKGWVGQIAENGYKFSYADGAWRQKAGDILSFQAQRVADHSYQIVFNTLASCKNETTPAYKDAETMAYGMNLYTDQYAATIVKFLLPPDILEKNLRPDHATLLAMMLSARMTASGIQYKDAGIIPPAAYGPFRDLAAAHYASGIDDKGMVQNMVERLLYIPPAWVSVGDNRESKLATLGVDYNETYTDTLTKDDFYRISKALDLGYEDGVSAALFPNTAKLLRLIETGQPLGVSRFCAKPRRYDALEI